MKSLLFSLSYFPPTPFLLRLLSCFILLINTVSLAYAQQDQESQDYPEEKRPHAIVALQHHYMTDLTETLLADVEPLLKRLVSDPALFYWHLAQMPEDKVEKEFCRAWICAEWQIVNSDNISDLLDHLSEAECIAILQYQALMSTMQKYLPEQSV